MRNLKREISASSSLANRKGPTTDGERVSCRLSFRQLGCEALQNLFQVRSSQSVRRRGWTYLVRHNALVVQVLAQAFHHFNLLLRREADDDRLDHAPDRRLVDGNEALVVHVGKKAHDKLAVHAVGHTSMPRDAVAKVLDFERPLQSRGEEAAERGNQRGKGGEHQDVKLHRRDPECMVHVRPLGQLVRLGREDGVGRAFQAGENVGAEVVDRTDEVFVAHQDVGEAKTKDERADPSSHKAFDRLFRRQFDELCAAKGDATEVGKDVVGDDQGGRKEEPDHPLKHVVHHEMCLHHDQIQGHMRPRELGKLESVVPLFERTHEEDEACQTRTVRSQNPTRARRETYR